MGGDFVIGLIIFVILITVNFVVITKGATRIAEVGARFTLDAIPGKQMSIDADLSAWAQAFRDDPELGAAVGFDSDPTEDSLSGRPQQNLEGAAEGAFVDLAIVDPADESVLLGGALLHSFDWSHMHTEVGFWLAPAARGGGVATEATALCVDWAFRELGMHRVEMTTLTDADRVLALADRLGFHREGDSYVLDVADTP